MNLKRVLILLLVLLALAAGTIFYLVRRSDYYYNLALRANQEIQEANRKPAINVGPNDNRPTEEVIQNTGPTRIVRGDKERTAMQTEKEATQSSPVVNVRDDKSNRRKTEEYYSSKKKLIAIEHFGEGGKLVRKDIYDDNRQVRLRQFYNTEGQLIYQETFDEKGKKIRGQPTMPIFPGRGIY